MKDLIENQIPYQVEFKIRKEDTKEIRDIYSTATYDSEQHVVFGVILDVTELKKTEEEIRMLGNAIHQSPSAIVITNSSGEIIFVNSKFTEMTLYPFSEIQGKKPHIFYPGYIPENELKKMWDKLQNNGMWKGEYLNERKDKSQYWTAVTISPLFDKKGGHCNYILVMEDITLKRQLREELIHAKEKAEEADKLKTSFLANMSHEIRTPLNSILGFSSLLSNTDFSVNEKNDFIQRIKISGENLLAIVSNVMDISKLEAGQMKILDSTIQLYKFIQDFYDQYLYKVENLNIDFQLDANINEQTFIISDETKIRQVLTNLVENALKFTQEGYIAIGVSESRSNGHITFYVEDTGIGIPEEYHKMIFERFRQVEMSETRQFGGNGLGLAISKNLVEMLGGKIWLESEFGKGSTFHFTIPKQIASENKN